MVWLETSTKWCNKQSKREKKREKKKRKKTHYNDFTIICVLNSEMTWIYKFSQVLLCKAVWFRFLLKFFKFIWWLA